MLAWRSRLQALQVLWQGVLLDVLLDVPTREMGLQILLHYEIQGSLGKVLGNATPTVGIGDLCVLQVHNSLAHILVQQDSTIMAPVESDGELAAPAVVLHADGAALLQRSQRHGGRRVRHDEGRRDRGAQAAGPSR